MRHVISDRRHFLQASLLTAGSLLVGFERLAACLAPQHALKDPLQGGQQLGLIDFVGEPHVSLDTLLGSELDGRLFTDLSAIHPQNPFLPTEKFYIRTRASQLLPTDAPWTIRLSGLVEKSTKLTLDDLNSITKPQGLHLMECAGNHRVTRFGMIGVADWTGIPIAEALATVKPKPEATRILISGFDRYSAPSANSVPGADWIFSLDQLKSAAAFLATQMNGQPLSPDHGAPVRLVVPGWYGCACIKWVNSIAFLGDAVEATSQMREYASRTHQQGIPRLVKDYLPATMDQAAMPIRVEKWLVGGKTKYRVVGILWGGSKPVTALEIRFNPEEDYALVDNFTQTTNDPWSFWSHSWQPKAPGTYMIRLRVKEPPVPAKRLDSGYYLRTVEIHDVQ